MYWWKTKKLAEDIRSGILTEKQKKNYYLASGIIFLLVMYIISALPASNSLSTLVEGSCVILINVIGINITFKTNKGNEGTDYVGRSVALSFPITIKIILITWIFSGIVGIISELTQSADIESWGMSIFVSLINAFYFWRLNYHLKTINT